MICPRKCGVRREYEAGYGICKMGYIPKIARAELHFWEEPCISGNNGSGTIFFSGCNLACVYCQNYEISAEGYGNVVSVCELSEIYKRLEYEGAENINLVNPTHFADAIMSSFEIYKPSIPIIYNSSGYENIDTLKRFEGIIDVYLPDCKYYNDRISKKYSNVSNYFSVVSRAIKEMVRQTGKCEFNKNGVIKRGTIIRHLILPGNTRDSINILKWISDNFKKDVMVSLMSQYIPHGNAYLYDEINRKITLREYNKVEEFLINLELEGYVQELSAANKCYIPDFKLN